jgi:hypothetical protein
MEASMSKRFESDGATRQAMAEGFMIYYQDADAPAILMAPDALREAERILSETEPRISESELVPLRAVFATNRDVNWRPLHWANEYGDALAASLSAVLPVLDELAQDATDAALGFVSGSGASVQAALLTMDLRDHNRATLAAMAHA